MQILYRLLHTGFEALFQLILQRQVVGTENFPEPPYILATNHISALDTPLLLTVCPHIIRAFAAQKHKRNPVFAPILYMAGTIWVRRGEIDRHSLREALGVLGRGEVLGIAPEGTRSRATHALLEGKMGAAYLATRADVPIVPIALTGTQHCRHNLLRLRRTRVRAAVGIPIHLPTDTDARSEQLSEYTQLIMSRIAELLPEEYRGAYKQPLKRRGSGTVNTDQ